MSVRLGATVTGSEGPMALPLFIFLANQEPLESKNVALDTISCIWKSFFYNLQFLIPPFGSCRLFTPVWKRQKDISLKNWSDIFDDNRQTARISGENLLVCFIELLTRPKGFTFKNNKLSNHIHIFSHRFLYFKIKKTKFIRNIRGERSNFFQDVKNVHESVHRPYSNIQ